VEDIKKSTQNDQVEFMELDLSSLRSIGDFATAFKAKNLPLHLLLNNAGVQGHLYALTEDGIEIHFGTNHIGHFFLTLLLIDTLVKSQPSRIVTVSSMAYDWAPQDGIPLDHLNDEAGYSPTRAYTQSKLANILFTRELAKRIGDQKVFANSLHPGVIKSEINRHVLSRTLALFRPLVKGFIGLMTSPENGALTQLYLSTSPDVEEKNIRGEYYVPVGKKGRLSPLGCNDEQAKKLWDFSVKFIKEKVPDFEVPEALRDRAA